MTHKKAYAGFKARILPSQTLYLLDKSKNEPTIGAPKLSFPQPSKQNSRFQVSIFFWTSASLRLCGETSNQRLGLQHPPQQVLLRHALPHPHILQLLLPPQELLRPFPCSQFPCAQFPCPQFPCHCPHPSSSHHRLTALHCKTLRHAQSFKTHDGVKAHL